MTDAEKLDFARRFFAAVERGDLDTVRSLYAPDAKIWTAQDPAERSPEENLAVLTWVKENVRSFRYEEVRCQPTPTGFVEQHVTCGTAPGGGEFRSRRAWWCGSRTAGSRVSTSTSTPHR